MPIASKPRARLSEEQVIAIFQAKTCAASATKVATVYGVSEKAVRDIWKGRTWSRETWHLDTSRPLQLKLTGRPKGCRDTKPRNRRLTCREETQSAPTGSTVTAQVLCRHHTDWHGVARHTLEPVVVQLQLDQNANQMVSCINESDASWPTSSRTRHGSVDEQLHEWDAFWRAPASADPFSGE